VGNLKLVNSNRIRVRAANYMSVTVCVFTIPNPIYTVCLSRDLDYLRTEALLQRETSQCAWRFVRVYVKTLNEQPLHSQHKITARITSVGTNDVDSTSEEHSPEATRKMGLDFGCGKETGNFLTYRETSISKV